MTRIIGGVAGGRRLQTPRGDHTRPTSDRVREALFSSIEAWSGSLAGLHVLDLYAGSGALGLEAWSRGAERVTLVESDRATAALISDNVRSLGCEAADVVHAQVLHALARRPLCRYDLILSDPPYDLSEDDLAADLLLLIDHAGTDALIVVERSRRSPEPRWPAGLEPGRSKRYGETMLWYGHARPAAQGSEQEDT